MSPVTPRPRPFTYPAQAAQGAAPAARMPEEIDRCPHCMVDNPNMGLCGSEIHVGNRLHSTRYWQVYACVRCGGAMLVELKAPGSLEVLLRIPDAPTVDSDIPTRAREFLDQALQSRHVAPAGAVILAASAVDAMLKTLGLKEGSLFSRIDAAAAKHLITDGMAKWAHTVRLDANEPRHADESAALPSPRDAERSIDFAVALGEFLFVLPARVRKGLKDVAPSSEADAPSADVERQ